MSSAVVQDPARRENMCDACMNWPAFWAELGDLRINVLVGILSQRRTPYSMKILLLRERLENFETEDVSARRLQELDESEWPEAGSHEYQERFQEFGQLKMQVHLMRHVVYGCEDHLFTSSRRVRPRREGSQFAQSTSAKLS
jgi:hypothetical protein